MNLEDLRTDIDGIDNQLVELFQKRMEVASNIADFKKANNMAIKDSSRERSKLNSILNNTEDEMKPYLGVLYSLLFELSRSYQSQIIDNKPQLYIDIENAIENTPKMLPGTATVACQGVEGAYSQLACDRIFKSANILYFSSFAKVFDAIDQGLCEYGVLPLENSTAGSVKKVYDLMIDHNFYIVKSTRLKVLHNLLVKPGTKLSDINEVYSHEQAINQCSEFLEILGKDVKITCCPNTAYASKLVAESERSDIAAISSMECCELYNLECLKSAIQNKDNNYTRFICISKKLEIFPGSDKTSLMMVLPHKPGSLYRVLSRIYALGINLIKLESRPIPEKDFEFMFYFDLETSVYSTEFIKLICELDKFSEEFKYLGSYLEVI